MNIIKFSMKPKKTFNSALFVFNVVGVADFVGSSLALTNREHRGLTILNFLFSMLSGCAQPQLTAIWLAGPLALGALAEHSDGSSRHRSYTLNAAENRVV